MLLVFVFFFFNDTATTEIYTLSLHDALPIFNEELSAPVSHSREESGANTDKSSTVSDSRVSVPLTEMITAVNYGSQSTVMEGSSVGPTEDAPSTASLSPEPLVGESLNANISTLSSVPTVHNKFDGTGIQDLVESHDVAAGKFDPNLTEDLDKFREVWEPAETVSPPSVEAPSASGQSSVGQDCAVTPDSETKSMGGSTTDDESGVFSPPDIPAPTLPVGVLRETQSQAPPITPPRRSIPPAIPARKVSSSGAPPVPSRPNQIAASTSLEQQTDTVGGSLLSSGMTDSVTSFENQSDTDSLPPPSQPPPSLPPPSIPVRRVPSKPLSTAPPVPNRHPPKAE